MQEDCLLAGHLLGGHLEFNARVTTLREQRPKLLRRFVRRLWRIEERTDDKSTVRRAVVWPAFAQGGEGARSRRPSQDGKGARRVPPTRRLGGTPVARGGGDVIKKAVPTGDCWTAHAGKWARIAYCLAEERHDLVQRRQG